MNDSLDSKKELTAEQQVSLMSMLQAEGTLVSLIREFGDIACVKNRRKRRDRAESLVLECAEIYQGHENAVLKGLDRDKKLVAALLAESKQPEYNIVQVIADLLGVGSDD